MITNASDEHIVNFVPAPLARAHCPPCMASRTHEGMRAGRLMSRLDERNMGVLRRGVVHVFEEWCCSTRRLDADRRGNVLIPFDPKGSATTLNNVRVASALRSLSSDPIAQPKIVQYLLQLGFHMRRGRRGEIDGEVDHLQRGSNQANAFLHQDAASHMFIVYRLLGRYIFQALIMGIDTTWGKTAPWWQSCKIGWHSRNGYQPAFFLVPLDGGLQ